MTLAPLRLVLLPACLAIAATAAAAAPPAAARLAGVVTRVIDGDTVVVQVAGRAPMDVRLRDIDAPESCQPWGPEAKKALEEMALGQNVELTPHGRDSYGRTVATLVVDGQNLGRRMVEEGHAWSVRTKWDNGPLVKQERQAKALNRGLHTQAGALPPREFRRVHGACGKR